MLFATAAHAILTIGLCWSDWWVAMHIVIAEVGKVTVGGFRGS